ncbi:alpha-amylase family glycosyl hydrolase [Paenibacillus sediminis]|uniref:Alpha-amylase n=2 Tax=Paenibacillus sediminis TaxID=664909 RepID=A0ABS4H327_9BACL|nr:glycosidase [Paenibacillus sediminis]
MRGNKSLKWSRGIMLTLAVASLSASLLAGCSKDSTGQSSPNTKQEQKSAAPKTAVGQTNTPVDEQPSTVFYEIFVRSFYDSNGDGIGDLRGVTEKLDYLNDGNPNTHDDLGVGGIWLMPINPSPSYHGYDVTDYRNINRDYGTLDDMKELIKEAHKRGIKVIMDFVVNHTSTEHPWFKEAAGGKDSKYRNYYVWAEDQKREPIGSSAAGSGNPWHEKNGAHYLGTFWEGMPDLNFDNSDVRKEMIDSGKFWLKLGVDGFRLDAAKHIYEDLASDKGEATTAKNVKWWQEFRSGMNEVNPNAYIVGEVWENSAVSVSAYLDNAFDSGFNFGLAESIVSAVQREQDANIGFTLERVYKLYEKKSQGKFVDAVFLTNHDQNRVMSQLSGNIDHAKMAASILLTLPGNPFIYYGEEIGMQGAKPDESIREPMVWNVKSGEAGQTKWEANRYNRDGSKVSVEAEAADKNSLLSYYRTLIQWRNEIPALHDGGILQYQLSNNNRSVMAYVRATANERVLVLHNLSSQEQQVSLSADNSFSSIERTTNDAAKLDNGQLTLPAYSTVILK